MTTMLNWLRRRSPQAQRLERLNAYIDGELTSAESTLFEIEMEEDAALRAEVAALRSVQQTLGQLPEADVPRNFTIAVEQPKQASSTPPLVFAGAFASLVLVAGIIFTLLNGGLGRQSAETIASQPTPVEVTRVVEQVVEVVKEVEVEKIVEVEVEVASETVVEAVVETVVEEVEVIVQPTPVEAASADSDEFMDDAMAEEDEFRGPTADAGALDGGDIVLFTIDPSDFSGTIEVHIDALDSLMLELANRFDNAGFAGNVAFGINSTATLEDFCTGESIDLIELDAPINSAEYATCSDVDVFPIEFVFVNDANGNPLYLATSLDRMRERPQVAALLNYALNNINTIIGSPPTAAVETFDYTPVSDIELNEAKQLWLDVITE